MNILRVCYYYIFPENSYDEYVILEYDKKYNEIIEYVEYSEQRTSKLAMIKYNVDHLSTELIKKSTIAIKYIGFKLLDVLAEIYYYNYRTINSKNYYNANSIRLKPIFKKKYITRELDIDLLPLLPPEPVFQENSCLTTNNIQLPLILDVDNDQSDLKRFFDVEEEETEEMKKKEQSLDEILHDIIQERRLKNI